MFFYVARVFFFLFQTASFHFSFKLAAVFFQWFLTVERNVKKHSEKDSENRPGPESVTTEGIKIRGHGSEGLLFTCCWLI